MYSQVQDSDAGRPDNGMIGGRRGRGGAGRGGRGGRGRNWFEYGVVHVICNSIVYVKWCMKVAVSCFCKRLNKRESVDCVWFRDTSHIWDNIVSL